MPTKSSIPYASKRRFLSIVQQGNYALVEAILSSPDGNINVAKRRPNKIRVGDAEDQKSTDSQSVRDTTSPRPADAAGDVIMALIGDERCVFKHSVFHEYFHVAVVEEPTSPSPDSAPSNLEDYEGPLCALFQSYLSNPEQAASETATAKEGLVWKPQHYSEDERELLSFDLDDYEYATASYSHPQMAASQRVKFMSFIRLLRLMVELAIGSGCNECQRALIRRPRHKKSVPNACGKGLLEKAQRAHELAIACALAMEPQRVRRVSSPSKGRGRGSSSESPTENYTYSVAPMSELRIVKRVNAPSPTCRSLNTRFRKQMLFGFGLGGRDVCLNAHLSNESCQHLKDLARTFVLKSINTLLSAIDSFIDEELAEGMADAVSHKRLYSALVDRSLDFAVYTSRPATLTSLLSYGASPSADKPLVVSGVSESVASQFFDHGFHPTQRPEMVLARCNSNLEILKVMYSEGFLDPFYRDVETKGTVLHEAVTHGAYQNAMFLLNAAGVLEALPENAANDNSISDDENDPLYCRILDEQLAYAREPTSCEAPLALVEADGYTPRCVCRLCRSIFARNSIGACPYRIARVYARPEVLNLFTQIIHTAELRRLRGRAAKQQLRPQ